MAEAASLAMLDLLAPDVTLWTDAGSKLRAARRVIQGRDKVARLLVAGVTRYRPADLAIRYAEVNGGPAALLFGGGELFGVLVVDPGEQADRVRAVSSVINPDKLIWLAGALRELPERSHTQGLERGVWLWGGWRVGGRCGQSFRAVSALVG